MAEKLSEAKLKEWMQKLGPRLIVLSTGICRDRHQAEEIVQEAFIKLWRRQPDAGEVAFSSWLRRVVTNLSINALQRTKRPSALPEYSTDPALQHDSTRDEREDVQDDLNRVSRAISRLDPAKRAILMLRARDQLSYEQIAEHLGVPAGTVMSRLNRARAALTKELEFEAEQRGEQPDSFDFRKYKSG